MQLAASALEAVSVIGSGDRVYIHGMAGAPQALVKALAERKNELHDVEIVQLHTEGVAPYAAPDMVGHFRVNALFVGANIRAAVNEGRADFVPVFLSEVPKMFRERIIPLDAVLIQVSPPDRHGFCSLGVSIEATRAAVLSAKHVIAQVNRHMPRTHGDGLIHVDSLTAVCQHDEPLQIGRAHV